MIQNALDILMFSAFFISTNLFPIDFLCVSFHSIAAQIE